MMTSEFQAKLKRSIIKHEGYDQYPYSDTKGKITIGYGYNLTDRGLPNSFLEKQYQDDVQFFYNQLYDGFSWFKNLNTDRQIILIDMCFMGYKNFLEFKRFLKAMAEGNYDLAAKEMLDSEWAETVKDRAIELASAMRTGIYNI